MTGKQQRHEECQEVGVGDGQEQGVGHDECKAKEEGKDDCDWSKEHRG